jgi:uncharacterized repeat protein (TIGR01451 family)
VRFPCSLTGDSGQRAQLGRKAGWLLCSLLFVGLAAPAAMAQTPAGTQISDSAEATYNDPMGEPSSAMSNVVTVTVGLVAGVDIVPPGSGLFDPGTSAVFSHTLTNTANGIDSIILSVTSVHGWATRSYIDANGDGSLDAADTQVAGPITLSAAGSVEMLVVADIPGLATAGGVVDTVDVVATSVADPAVSDGLQDIVQVRDAGIATTLTKSVDLSNGTTGDTLTYTIDYSASGPSSANSFELSDAVPAGAAYVPGSLLWNGSPVTDAAGDDGGHFDTASNRVVFTLPGISGGEAGAAQFQVQITATGAGTVDNQAEAVYQTSVGPDSVVSNIVQTTVVVPELFVQKSLTSSNVANIGEDVQYTITYGNSSTTTVARNSVLSDTIPIGLELVSAQPPPQVSGQILTWDIGDIAASDTAQIDLTVRVSQTVQDTLRVRNIVVLDGVNTGAEVAIAEEVALVGLNSSQLALEKSADVLEVSVGETVPYTVVVENTGTVPVTGVIIHDVLPDGGEYSNGSLIGADSIGIDGRNLTIFAADNLAPGSTHTVHYTVAIVSAATDVVANRAYASAENELVASDEAVAWVRISTSWPMETRSAIGKVWVDYDADGVQDPDEPGVEGVDIWSGNGIVATSDADGKFSFVNLRPGQHSFRLDNATVPLSHQTQNSGYSRDLAIENGDGWTTPRINFPLIPSEGRMERVYLPLAWQFLARPIKHEDKSDTTTAAEQEMVVVDSTSAAVVAPDAPVQAPATARPDALPTVHFDWESARLTSESIAILDEAADSLRSYLDVCVEVAGHTDSMGRMGFNLRLAPARAKAVMDYLVEIGIDPSRMVATGYGPFRPVATNTTPEGRSKNRRVELNVVNDTEAESLVSFCRELRTLVQVPDSTASDNPPVGVEEVSPDKLGIEERRSNGYGDGRLVEYELVVKNDYDMAVSGVVVRFDPLVDSAMVLGSDSTLVKNSTGEVALPSIEAHSSVTILGWTVTERDSAVAFIEGSNRPADRLEAEIHNPLRPVTAITTPRASADSLPNPTTIPEGSAVEIVIAPSVPAWPDLTFPLAPGWHVIDGSSRVDNAPATEPTVKKDRSGKLYLQWTFASGVPAMVNVKLTAGGRTRSTEQVTVPILRTDEERKQERNRSFITGPGVEIFSPPDGTVLQSERLFVGVRGEATAPVALYDGDSLIAEATLRIDGVHDFIGVPLSPGPHKLRVRMLNSWKQERWDSMNVHVTAPPATLETPTGPIRLTADGSTIHTVRVCLKDAWGVPVIRPTNVTVTSDGADVIGADSDASSVGMQLQSDVAGWLTIDLRPGSQVRIGELSLRAGDLAARIPLEILPSIRPFMFTGIGRVGVGASPDALGTITARGSIDHRTSIVLSYDSRRLDAGRDAMGRAFDPLEEAQYPILGDASQLRTLSASQHAFAARVERGFDWITVGDIATSDFAAGLGLTTYRRSLTGGAARITTGDVVWQGFGSLTSQSLRQAQIRGAGTSGPYGLEADVIPASEQITIETRAAANAERVINRQSLIRFIDYQIDYERGIVQFKHPIPAADPYGNSVFVVATYEVERGGDQRVVAGLRASVDARNLFHYDFLDSLRIGVTGIRADEPLGAHHLAGADFRLLKFAGLDIGAEVSYSDTPDSSGFASAIKGAWHGFDDLVTLRGAWTKVGNGFGNPSNVALQGGTEELKVGGEVQLGAGKVNLQHERQSFRHQGAQRTRTSAGVVQPLGQGFQLDVSGSTDHLTSSASTNASQAAQLKLTWSPLSSLQVWSEGRHQFANTGDAFLPSYFGAGAQYEIHQGVSLEARHLRMAPSGDTPYSVTRLGVRSNIGFGTQVWGSYQLAGGANGSRNAAIVGLNNNLRLNAAWTVTTMFERRVGLNNTSIGDPVRAMPFVQNEEDYWSLGLGIELLPEAKPYRLSARGEYRDGNFQSTQLFTMAGDISINRSFAILSRQEFHRIEQFQADQSLLRRRLHSLWGAAFRPISSDALNVLTKFSWLDESNPRIGALTQTGDEQRLIAAAEVIWAPAVKTELAGRYAVRHSVAQRPTDGGVTQRLESWADYLGMRVQQNINQWVSLRAEGRLLLEHTSDTQRWDATPTLAVVPISALEVSTGYRFGNLMDPDFSVHGGFGWFFTVSARVTETVFPSAAEFWRSRFDK